MEAFGITYRDAMVRVENATAQLLQRLKEAGELNLDEIGTLKLNGESAIEFHPCNGKLLNAPYYGLPEIRIRPHNQLKKEPSTSQQPYTAPDTIYIPVNKKVLKRIASVAAIVAFIICFSLPVNTGRSVSALNAGMIPSLPPAVENIPAKSKSAQILQFDTTGVTEETSPAKTKNKLPAQTENAIAYYIIVGSFPNNKSAEKELDKLKNKGFESSGIIIRNGRIRLYPAKFGSKEEAETQLPFYKKQLNRDDAWIFSCK